MTTDTMSTDTMTTDTLTTEAADVTATVIDHPETVGSSGKHRSGKPGKPAKAPKAPRASKAPKAFRASETPEATKVPKPARQRRRLGWLRVLVLPVVALLTIGFFVAALVMHLTNKTPAQRAPLNPETRAAIAKANADVKDILSYDYRSLNSDISSAKADLTGQLLTDYTASASKILAQAPPIKAIVTATVSAQAVESADTNRVTLLMYIDQESVKQLKGQKTPSTRIDPLRVRVSMTKVNGAWKASNLEPI